MDAETAAALQDLQGSHNINFRIKQRLFEGFPHIGARSLVAYDLRLFALENLSQAGIADVQFMESDARSQIASKTGREVIIAADHTKCGVVSTAFVAPLTSMQKLVTDDKTSRKFVSALKAHGIDVIVV